MSLVISLTNCPRVSNDFATDIFLQSRAFDASLEKRNLRLGRSDNFDESCSPVAIRLPGNTRFMLITGGNYS